MQWSNGYCNFAGRRLVAGDAARLQAQQAPLNLAICDAVELGDLRALVSTKGLRLPATLSNVSWLCLPPNLEELEVPWLPIHLLLGVLARAWTVQRLTLSVDCERSQRNAGDLERALNRLPVLVSLHITCSAQFEKTYNIVTVPARVKKLRWSNVCVNLPPGESLLEAVAVSNLPHRGGPFGFGFDYKRLGNLKTVEFLTKDTAKWIWSVPTITSYTGYGESLCLLWKLPLIAYVNWITPYGHPIGADFLWPLAMTQKRVTVEGGMGPFQTAYHLRDALLPRGWWAQLPHPDSIFGGSLLCNGNGITTQQAVDLLRAVRRRDCSLRALCIEAVAARAALPEVSLTRLPPHLLDEVTALELPPRYLD